MTPRREMYQHKRVSSPHFVALALGLMSLGLSACGEGGDEDTKTYGLQKRPQNETCKAPNSVDDPPMMLSETGCFSKEDPKRPSAGLIPYGVNNALWSDNAEKLRWMAIPDGSKVTVNNENGDLDFPVGSVLLKHFSIDGIALETRFLSRQSDGQWAAYTYIFDDEGNDAKILGDQNDYRFIPKGDDLYEWIFPSRKNCFGCHTKSANISIGLETAQLDGLFEYPGKVVANQMETLRHIGVVENKATAPVIQTALANLKDDKASAEQKARSYLQANCAYCHQGNEVKDITMDLRMELPLSKMNACDVKPSKNGYGIENVKIIAPGDPDRSMLLFRMKSTIQDVRMPAFGTKLVDEDAVKAIETWIASLKSCDSTN